VVDGEREELGCAEMINPEDLECGYDPDRWPMVRLRECGEKN
jgi:hypothetical protein